MASDHLSKLTGFSHAGCSNVLNFPSILVHNVLDKMHLLFTYMYYETQATGVLLLSILLGGGQNGT